MYFRLLFGVHVEKGKRYATKSEKDPKSGAITVVEQPVVESDKDLVSLFGGNKFQRISKEEANALLKRESGQPAEEAKSPEVPEENEVSKAVSEGAKEIAEPPGVEVTHKFPEIEDDKIKVFFKRGTGYFVVDEGKVVTEEPLKRDEVVGFVQTYRGG